MNKYQPGTYQEYQDITTNPALPFVLSASSAGFIATGTPGWICSRLQADPWIHFKTTTNRATDLFTHVQICSDLEIQSNVPESGQNLARMFWNVPDVSRCAQNMGDK